MVNFRQVGIRSSVYQTNPREVPERFDKPTEPVLPQGQHDVDALTSCSSWLCIIGMLRIVLAATRNQFEYKVSVTIFFRFNKQYCVNRNCVSQNSHQTVILKCFSLGWQFSSKLRLKHRLNDNIIRSYGSVIHECLRKTYTISYSALA